MKIYTEVNWKMEDCGKLTEISSKSEEYNGELALCGETTGDPGDWGIFGTAAGSEARTASDMGFDSVQELETWKAGRDPLKDATKGAYNVFKQSISPEGKYYGLEEDRKDVISDYDDAVFAFDQATLAKDVAEGEYGTFTGGQEAWDDLTEEEKGEAFEEAGEDLAQDELDRKQSLVALEDERAAIRGKSLTAADKAEMARMGTGMAYSGSLEEKIKRGELSTESLIQGTEAKEDIIISDWKTAMDDYDDELLRIQNEWAEAKLAWEKAYDDMYKPETGDLARYESGIAEIQRKGRLAIAEDTQLSTGLEGIKGTFEDYWNLDTEKGPGGPAWAETHFMQGDVPFGDHAGTAIEQYTPIIGRTHTDLQTFGGGYGGYGEIYDNLKQRFELAKSVYGDPGGDN